VCAAVNGDTIPAPISPIDGYQYPYSEVQFWWSRTASFDTATKLPSGGGCILSWADNVSATGVVSIATNYFIDGGADTPTTDGGLLVVLLCQRDSSLHFAAVPTWADVEDADLAGGEAVLASILQQMNDNTRYAAVRKEFFVQKLYDGQTITAPVSPVDGYAYRLVYGAIASPAAPTLGAVAGGDLAARTEYCAVTIVNAQGETLISSAASLAVPLDELLQVAAPTAVAGATGWNVYTGPTATMVSRQNASVLPFGFPWTEPTTGIVGGTVPPTLNTTASSEVQCMPSMISSLPASGHTSGSGTIRQFGCCVGGQPNVTTPATVGAVASYVNYYVNGGALTDTTDGTILVLIVATRERGNPPIPPAVRMQPPAATTTSFGALALPPGGTIGGFPIKGVGSTAMGQILDINGETENELLYGRHSPVLQTAITPASNLASGQKVGGDSGAQAFGTGGFLGIGGVPGLGLDVFGSMRASSGAGGANAFVTDDAAGGVEWRLQSLGGVLNELRAGIARRIVNATGHGFDRTPTTQTVEAGGSFAAQATTPFFIGNDTTVGGRSALLSSNSGNLDLALNGVRSFIGGPSGWGADRVPSTYEVESAGNIANISTSPALIASDTAGGGVEIDWESLGGVLSEYRAGGLVRTNNSVGSAFQGTASTDNFEVYGNGGSIRTAQPYFR